MSLKKALIAHTLKCMSTSDVLELVNDIQCQYCGQNLLDEYHRCYKCEKCLRWECTTVFSSMNKCIHCNIKGLSIIFKNNENILRVHCNYNRSFLYITKKITDDELAKHNIQYDKIYDISDLVFKLNCLERYRGFFEN